MINLSRRQFIHDSLLASAAAAAAAGSATSLFAADDPQQNTSPNEKISIAVIGVNGRGKAHLDYYGQRSDVEVVAICDADADVGQKRCEEFARKHGYKPRFVQDLRKVFEDNSIACVTIATPNHWHALAAIWALQAGKDVLVEKPVSHNVSEGRRIVETAEKYNRICQVGTQSRSAGGARQAIEYIRSGKLGEIKLARGLCYKPRPSIGPAGKYNPPPRMDYDLWCGPAPVNQPTRNGKNGTVHYDWHWFWDYGNGDIGNQGIHQMDIARWGLGLDRLPTGVISYGGRLGYVDAAETPNTLVSVFDYGPKTIVFETRGLPTEKHKQASQSVGVVFEGTEGYATIGADYENACFAFDRDGNQVEHFQGACDHFGNFLKAVRSRKSKDIDAPILEGHISSALCHLGNISYLLGQQVATPAILERLKAVKMNDNAQETLDRTVEHLAKNGVKIDADAKFRCGEFLKFDPQTETFPGNAKANELCSREYRAPFVVPAAGKV